MYLLSSPCADYESLNSPFRAVEKIKRRLCFNRFKDLFSSKHRKFYFEKDLKRFAIPTNNVIRKSRQDIFCDTVGVDFNINNYNVIFTDEEHNIACDFVGDKNFVVGVQIKSSTKTRDYKYSVELVEYISKFADLVIVFDSKWRYSGSRLNIKSSTFGIRQQWANIAKLSMLIGPDSFGVHAAGSLGIPTYGIFGPTDPKCRLTNYECATWNEKWRLPIARRGLKRGCGRQYCWYQPCKHISCINSRSPKYYWEDAIKKLEGVL